MCLMVGIATTRNATKTFTVRLLLKRPNSGEKKNIFIKVLKAVASDTGNY